LVVRRRRQAWRGGIGEGGLELGLHGVAEGVAVGEQEVGEEGLVDVEEAEVDGFEAGLDEEQEDAPAAAHLLPMGVLARAVAADASGVGERVVGLGGQGQTEQDAAPSELEGDPGLAVLLVVGEADGAVALERGLDLDERLVGADVGDFGKAAARRGSGPPARLGLLLVSGAGIGLSSVGQIGVHGCRGRVVGLFVLGLQRLVELAGEGGDTVHPGQDLGRDGTVESHLHVDRAAGDGVAGLGSAPFSVKLMWELGWLYVGERRLWTLHLVSWPTDAKTSPTRYQPLTV